MKCLKQTIARLKWLHLSKRIVFRNTCLPWVLLLSMCQITHADILSRNLTPVLDSATTNSAIQPETDSEELELPLIGEENDKSLLSFGGSLGFGASYVVLGVKAHIETPYARLFALIGLGVAAGVDIKLGSVVELGLTRAISLGGAGWDVAALRYHPNGAFESGWFVGLEYIGNRIYIDDSLPGESERQWVGTFGYEF